MGLLKTYYTNVDNSVMSKYDLLTTLNVTYDFDIITLTEIKPKFGTIPELASLTVPGYDTFTSDLSSPNTRGTCIYTKISYKAKQIFPDVEEAYTDSVWATITGQNNCTLLLGVIYRSGTPALAQLQDNRLHSTLSWAASSNYSHKLIVGDFNHPVIQWEPSPVLPSNISATSPQTRFVECIRDTFLHQHVSFPTRFREGQTPTLDDLVFTNETEMIDNLDQLDPLGASDHIGLSFITKFDTNTPPTIKTVSNYNKGNYTAMKDMLSIDWDDELRGLSVQEMTDRINEAITSAVNKWVPKKIINTNTKKKPLWMNHHALLKVKKKHHAWIRYLNTKDGQDYQRYVSARNIATHTIRKTRREFETKLAQEIRTNNKGFWTYVNSRRKTQTTIPDLCNEEGILVNDTQAKAEVLNRQYSKVFTRENLSTFPTFEDKTLQEELRISLTKERVLSKLLTLRIDKSPGPDGIHPRVLKELAETLATPLFILFEASIEQGIVPNQWKMARVTPIYKKGNKSDPVNYRPVSLTSVISKIFERILSEDLTDHLKKNNLLCSQQHGFTKGKSTVTNLLEAMDVWTEALSHNLPVDVIFLDYAKAFDKVPHQRLLAQLGTLGIRNNIMSWLRSFLTDRKQQVIVGDKVSEWSDVHSGVPQGTVLGPLLFTMFIADVPDLLDNYIAMFADDTKIYQIVEDLDSGGNLQDDLERLEAWANTMQMIFHPDKCKVMHLGSNNPRQAYTMTTENGAHHTLKVTEEEKDLGVIVDHQLRFSKHIQTQVSKANRVLGAIKHTFSAIDKNAFLCLYKSLVRPHLEYASTVWSPVLKRDKDALEQVQRRATRLVEGLSHLSYGERLAKLELPTLSSRRERADLIQAFKIIKGVDSVNYSRECNKCGGAMFRPAFGTATRGHSLKMHVQYQLGPRRNFLPARVTEKWNKLGQNTVDSANINIFKTSLAKEWKNRLDIYNYKFSY